MAKGKNYLKGRFETGDVPSQSDFEDLIDSAVNLADDVDGTIPDSPAAGHVPTSGAVKSYVAAEVAKLPSKAEVTQLSSKVGDFDASTKGSLSNQVDSLNTKINGGNSTTLVEQEQIQNKYLNSSNSFIPSSPNLATLNGTNVVYLQVSEGDKFKVKGVGTTDHVNLWVTADSSRNIVRKSGKVSARTTPIDVDIASGEAYLVVNLYNYAEGDCVCKYQTSAVTGLSSKVDTLTTKVASVETDVSNLKPIVNGIKGEKQTFYEEQEITLHKYWNTSSAAVGSSYVDNKGSETSTPLALAKISVLEGEKYRIYQGASTGAANRSILLTKTEDNEVYVRGGYSASYRDAPREFEVEHDGFLYVNFYDYDSTIDKVEKVVERYVGGYEYYVDSAVSNSKLLKGKTLIALGDSQVGQVHSSFASIIKEKIGINVLNCGFGGMRMTDSYDSAHHHAFCFVGVADALVSGDFDAMDAAFAAWSGKPEHYASSLANIKAAYQQLQGTQGDGFIISVAYGSNDFSNSIGLGTHGVTGNKAMLYPAMEYSLETLMAAYPKAIFMYVGLPWIVTNYNTEGSVKTITETSDEKTATISGQSMTRKDYSDLILANAENLYHIPTYDYYRHSGKHKFNAFLVGSDGVHFSNAFGGKLAADFYIKALTSIK